MSEFGKHKLSDAVPHLETKSSKRKKGKPTPNQATDAEQIREAQESAQARDAEASIRDHMVDIGRGNQQAGRQGQG